MNKKKPFPLVSCHILPEPVKAVYEEGRFADLTGFTLEISSCFPKAELLFRKLFPFCGKNGRPFRVLPFETARDPEAYSIEAGEDSVEIRAASDRGALYAAQSLKQTRYGPFIPVCHIVDAPAVPVRGFHANLATVKQYEGEDVRRLLGQMAKFKLNTFLLEYNERFPFAGHPAIAGVNAFTPEDTASFEIIAQENGIEIMPLVQCLGHNAHIARCKEYRPLFERDAGNPEETRETQLCPLNPDSFELFKDLASEVLAAHPHGKYLHIGGDETRSLGACPKCAEFAVKYGKGRLYADYVNKAAAWVKSQGRIPVIWDDMLSRNNDVIPLMDRDLVIMNWDYWTTTDPSPVTVFRPAGKGIVLDRSLAADDFEVLEEPERLIARTFGRTEDLQELVRTDPAAGKFRKYLGSRFPQYCTAFPFVDFYQEHGFRVLCAPTTLGNTVDDIYGLPNFMRYRKNIQAFAAKCKRNRCIGMITSSWYDFAPEITELGLICTANDLWRQ